MPRSALADSPLSSGLGVNHGLPQPSGAFPLCRRPLLEQGSEPSEDCLQTHSTPTTSFPVERTRVRGHRRSRLLEGLRCSPRSCRRAPTPAGVCLRTQARIPDARARTVTWFQGQTLASRWTPEVNVRVCACRLQDRMFHVKQTI